MKRIKNLLCVMIVMFAFSASSYAVEFSLGSSFGGSVPFFRGSDSKDFTSILEATSGDTKPSRGGFHYQADLMLEFSPYFAIETGLGYSMSSITYSDERLITVDNQNLYIPIMLRGQYEWTRNTFYVSAGVKLGFPMGREYLSGIYIQPRLTPSIEKSKFSMDASFAIGSELRIGKANYLGIRIGYDLNVIQTFDKKEFEKYVPSNPVNNFIDDVNFSVTYRYAFGSKWNKA